MNIPIALVFDKGTSETTCIYIWYCICLILTAVIECLYCLYNAPCQCSQWQKYNENDSHHHFYSIKLMSLLSIQGLIFLAVTLANAQQIHIGPGIIENTFILCQPWCMELKPRFNNLDLIVYSMQNNGMLITIKVKIKKQNLP